jgi:hypothetical protein
MARFFIGHRQPPLPLISLQTRLMRRCRSFTRSSPPSPARCLEFSAMNTPNPLAQGNRFQRAYYRWALPHYERIGRDDPALREKVELADRFLYSRQGLGAWAGWLAATVATAIGLHRLGMPIALATGLSAMGWVAISFALLGAWLQPGKVTARWNWRRFVGLLALWATLGGWAGFTVGHVVKHGRFDPTIYWSKLVGGLDVLLPAVAGTGVGLALLLWAVASMTAKVQNDRLARAQLVAERDTAARQAAETELRLLQVQIHPHFVFNTLATLQHWVDKADPRAGPLLRELTGFLRRSTEMLGRQQVPLAEEAQSAAHYLAIMQTRMGDRLQTQIDIDPRCGQQTLPPGLLLTLVENAIEHGLEPKIGGGSLQIHSACTDTGWWLRVDDDGIGLAPDASDNVGLTNLRLRLQQHYGPGARFTLSPRPEGGTRAEICFEENPCPAS